MIHTVFENLGKGVLEIDHIMNYCLSFTISKFAIS